MKNRLQNRGNVPLLSDGPMATACTHLQSCSTEKLQPRSSPSQAVPSRLGDTGGTWSISCWHQSPPHSAVGTKSHLCPLLHGTPGFCTPLHQAFDHLRMAEQHQEERLRFTHNPRKACGVCLRHTQATHE